MTIRKVSVAAACNFIMYEILKNFNRQFAYQPVIGNAGKLKRYKRFVVIGMGGSHLAADLIKIHNPELDLIIHSSYGLPALSKEAWKDRLVIASSYSGNTEEVLDAFNEAFKRKLPAASISIGGKLLEAAKKRSLPYIKMPDLKTEPRLTLGQGFIAMLKLMGDAVSLKESAKLAKTLNSSAFESNGKALAKLLKGYVPVIYSSADNWAIAYNWKIKFNETGKAPAFYNVLPELNHNEMIGFDVRPSTKELTRGFYFLFLKDPADHPRIQKRMAILDRLYKERGLPVEMIEMKYKGILKIFSSLMLADWTTYYFAKSYGIEPQSVPMVEEFKKLIA